MKKLLVLSLLALMALSGMAFAYGSFQAPMTGGSCIETSGTVGTSPTVELATSAQGPLRGALKIHNPAAAGGTNIAFTLDGSVPVIGGNGTTLYAGGGTALFDVWVPQGPVTIVGSGASSPWSICIGQ